MGKTNNADNAALYYEGGQTPYAMQVMTDSSDHQRFNSPVGLWSQRSGFEPVVHPDGLISGGAVTPTSGQNDKIEVGALTCYLAGTKNSVNAASGQAVTRGASANVCCINSVTVTSAGVVAIVAGTAAPTFSETRGAAGGPPFIPVGSIEIAQVRLSSITAAPVKASEIYAVAGVHQERFDFPLWDELYSEGAVNFLTSLPLIHTGGTAKKVYASFAEPIFAEMSPVSDFVPPEESHSLSSKQVYGTTLGSSSSSLGQGSFTAYLKDGISEPLVALKGLILWFKFFPDRYSGNYMLTQGKLGISRTFPAGDSISAKCTISADTPAKEVKA